MRRIINKSIIFLSIIFCASIFLIADVHAVTSNANVNVTASVVNGNNTCTNCTTGGDNPPQIINLASSTTQTAAQISWQVTDDHPPLSSVTLSYGLSPGVLNLVGPITTGTYPDFQANLSGLATDTLYYFQINALDSANQAAAPLNGTFRTLSATVIPLIDTTAPDVTNVIVKTGVTTTSISWANSEPASTEIDYGQTLSYGSKALDNNLSLSPSILLINLLPNTTYYYRIISTDASQNSASKTGQFKTEPSAIPPPNVQNIQISNTNNSISLSWTNPSLNDVPDFVGVKIIRTIGSPAVSVNDPAGTVVYSGPEQSFTDNSVSANINYYYTIFSYNTSLLYSTGAITNTTIVSVINPNVCPVPVDCNNPACVGDQACQHVIALPPTSTVNTGCTVNCGSSFYGLTLDKVNFLAGAGKIILTPKNNVLSSLSGSVLSVVLPKKYLIASPQQVSLVIDNRDEYLLSYNVSTESYYTDISVPGDGSHLANIKIIYDQARTDALNFTLIGLAPAKVSGDSGLLPSVSVSLYQDGVLFNAGNYNQQNPVVFDSNGTFGWVVPNGQYYVVAVADGYFDRQTPTVAVTNNVYNFAVNLVAKPKKILEGIDLNAPITDNLLKISGNLASQAKAIFNNGLSGLQDAAIGLQQEINKPEVKNAAANVVAPAAVGAVAIGTISLISWTNLLPLLRLLFLQPLLLINRRKRKGWGQVYNALNKLPVDLATLRLVDVNTGRVVQTKVSDRQGRYAFVAPPGQYKIEVIKQKLTFPSTLLHAFETDGQRVDLYHGEVINVTEDNAVITANIPLDPLGEVKHLPRIFWARFGRGLQVLLSWTGIFITGASFYISPRWYVGVLFGVHLILFFVFRHFALPAKIKSWGIVYDANNKSPVNRTIARLFSKQFNKLVSTQVTDNRGRYYFMAGDNQYYVTFEHPEYIPGQTGTIDLKNKDAANIAVDVGLQKPGAVVPPSQTSIPEIKPPEIKPPERT